MEISWNKCTESGMFSVFLPMETKLEGRTHVGYVCDANTSLCGQMKLYEMALYRNNGKKSAELISRIFRGLR